MSNLASADNLSKLASIAGDAISRLPVEKIRFFSLLLIGVWFVAMLAEIFWLAMPMPQQPAVVPPMPNASSLNHGGSAGSSSSAINVPQMQSWNLFGEEAKSADDEVVKELQPADATVGQDAKETRLKLSLLGVITSTDPANGYAVLEYQNKAELYRVGDKIPGGRDVSLFRVHTDRAIIDNRGNYEAVLLYDETVKSTQKPVARPRKTTGDKVVDHRRSSSVSALAKGYRDQLLSNPMSLAEVIRISPAKGSDGSIIGYRVRPGKHRQQFSDLGLKSGDIVTSVNGVELSDPSNAMQLYGQLRELTEATFAVKRGDEEITLIVGLE
ncbi:Type II secretion system protein C [BD1-7 clade bacterium]|uniref:Type II secretion system protein C n=1 Tax=BD1-7 clade bacterium TaxID=2029982 RepID=A0A5S9PQ89_9GAMM|nr:Type II secretion system protein C [BD1-7 clade bacterium]CAA0106379.1 Type II secretion system protein C [BD1-7 clade bacterium]